MTNKKYEFTGEVNAQGLKRIKRLSDGVIGGWIESEKNLSQEGDAWVFGDAQVFGAAQVSGDARVFGAARVSGDAQVSQECLVIHNSKCLGFTITFTDNLISIGCQIKTPKQWLKVTLKQALELGVTKNQYKLLLIILKPLIKVYYNV